MDGGAQRSKIINLLKIIWSIELSQKKNHNYKHMRDQNHFQFKVKKISLRLISCYESYAVGLE